MFVFSVPLTLKLLGMQTKFWEGNNPGHETLETGINVLVGALKLLVDVGLPFWSVRPGTLEVLFSDNTTPLQDLMNFSYGKHPSSLLTFIECVLVPRQCCLLHC